MVIRFKGGWSWFLFLKGEIIEMFFFVLEEGFILVGCYIWVGRFCVRFFVVLSLKGF